LIWCDQGVGDAILHSTMLADLRPIAGAVRIETDPRLVPLFVRSFPWAEAVASGAEGERDADVDFQVSAGSLGRFLRPTRQSFPPAAPFLRAAPAAVAALRARYREAAGGRPLVGLSWRSSASRFKNAPLAEWGPILATGGHFVSLQYGETAADIEAASAVTGIRVAVDPSVDPLLDLDAFAAQVAAMDLVVTTSNTTAHVAGALGIPCWVMVPKGRGALWYWFDDADRSPWYGSVRLFHQEGMFDWAATIRRVGDALAQPAGAWIA
jgi:ADP-heptose:LPS heptosyltransferase